MNKENLKKLVNEASNIDPQNEILAEINITKRFEEMSENLESTICYLDNCSENELFWATEVLEDLAQHFKSQILIDCVVRNIARCCDREIKKQLEITLLYMKKHI